MLNLDSQFQVPLSDDQEGSELSIKELSMMLRISMDSSTFKIDKIDYFCQMCFEEKM